MLLSQSKDLEFDFCMDLCFRKSFHNDMWCKRLVFVAGFSEARVNKVFSRPGMQKMTTKFQFLITWQIDSQSKKLLWVLPKARNCGMYVGSKL